MSQSAALVGLQLGPFGTFHSPVGGPKSLESAAKTVVFWKLPTFAQFPIGAPQTPSNIAGRAGVA